MRSFIIFYRSMGELVRSSPKLTFLLLCITILIGFIPLISIFSLSGIVSSLIANDTGQLITCSIIWVVSLAIPGILSSFIILIQSSLSENMFSYLSKRLMHAINNISYLNIFENEKIHNDIDIIRNNISNRPVNLIVAIVGKNGAGKTTLARILMGLLKPTSGELLVNNIPVEEYGIKNYWKKCSFVPQLFAQFKFTLHESIFIGREYNTNNSIINRDLFTEGLPAKDSQLSKEFSGTDLSGGQWQKIAIMRAVFNNENTDMLFFDEPTSAIDPLVEEEVYNLIEEISKNKIAVYITHRMSTVTHANHIILLNDNHIAADGKHEDLYSTNTLYRKMFDAQAKRFITV